MLGPPNENPPAVAAAEGLEQRPAGAGLFEQDKALREYRQRRFAAQRAMAGILRSEARAFDPDAYPSDRWRVIGCLWCRVGDAMVMRSKQHGRAHYKGLSTCGSVWLCPICAAKVEERRRDDVSKVFAWSDAQGYDSTMLTNTFPHGMGDALEQLFVGQAKALKLFRDHRVYRRAMKEIGQVGIVRGLELTYGANGWHPHTHEVKFHRERLSEDDAKLLRHKLVEPWRQSCISAGLIAGDSDELAFYRHAIDLRPNFTCGDYLQKTDSSKTWTPAHEVAKGSSKAGRRSGLHPFALVLDGRPCLSDLIVEYAKATKGKRKLFFSPGLKAKAGVVDLTDEEIAAIEDDASMVVANVTAAWKFIQRTDAQHGTRARVLEVAEAGGKDGIAELLWNMGFDPFAEEL